jgi:hypothetical protein
MEEALLNSGDNGYYAVAALTDEETCELIEIGHKFVTDIEGNRLLEPRD